MLIFGNKFSSNTLKVDFNLRLELSDIGIALILLVSDTGVSVFESESLNWTVICS